MPLALVLPPELTIHAVGDLRLQWMSRLDSAVGAEPFEIDGSQVTEVDAAGLQLLQSLVRSGVAERRRLLLYRPSPTLRGACELLGLHGLLDAALGEAA
ncbi:MAG: STAS domain-containing protein [Burkholderiales bacterium]|nr:STAS domain-containing protein [Burkholderiales bacterium]MDE2396853.1 STAS domain-containing protein [Burkholderiales bacterium]MDE2456439.1 STAS domain-containing protein [Burkholderiales bacterium]